MIKIFLAGMLTETNTFCPFPTEILNFKQCCYTNEFDIGTPSYWQAPLKKFSELAENKGWPVTRSICATAMPAGPVTSTAYKEIKTRIINDLSKNLPIDVIFLHLHGAMVAENCNDCEGDLLASIRDIVGPGVIISALLDPHTHLSEKMSANSDVLIWMKEYPHIDGLECTEKIFQIVNSLVSGKVKVTSASYDCQSIGLFPTNKPLMASLVSEAKAFEQQTDILSISLIHGFPWGDTADTGSKVHVITNNNPMLAKEISTDFGKKLSMLAREEQIKCISIEKMLEFVSRHSTKSKPIIFADYADNVGGGAPGDSTYILEALVKHKIHNFALASIYDRKTVNFALRQGENSRIKISLGGKLGKTSGKPVPLEVIVKKIRIGMMISFAEADIAFGTTVSLLIPELHSIVVVNDIPCQVYSIDCFTKLGVTLEDKSAVIVKSSEHFRASFSKISKNIHIVATPGSLDPCFKHLAFKKLKRSVYPINT